MKEGHSESACKSGLQTTLSCRGKEPFTKTKPFSISKQVVLEGYCQVKANQGAAGVDGQSIKDFEVDLKDNLYKIWNRMSSGSYFPPPVRTVDIPKSNGRSRRLGISAVSDRVAQMVVKMYFEPEVDLHFHPDSYGYRPGKSALEAVGVARKRCWCYDWVLDLDIKAFFDEIDHGLLMRAVRRHTDSKWLLLYIERWLKAPVQAEDGTLISREKGSPQGSVISPLLANLFLHYAFDEWMRCNYGNIPFERYADDILVHCKSEEQAKWMKTVIEERLKQCGLELHPEKTKIVYCKGSSRKGSYPNEKFDFLGYTFRARLSIDRSGRFFVGFLPAVSDEAAKTMRRTIRSWRIHRMTDKSIKDLAYIFNPIIRSWINYYGRFYKSALRPIFNHSMAHCNDRPCGSTKSCVVADAEPFTGLGALRSRCPICLRAGDWRDNRLVDKSRMNREVHVRFCEGLRGKFPRPTRPFNLDDFVISRIDQRYRDNLIAVFTPILGYYLDDKIIGLYGTKISRLVNI